MSGLQIQGAATKEDKARSEATFRFTVHNFSGLKSRVSPSFYVRNLPWNIMVRRRKKDKYIGFFVQCNRRSDFSSWSCWAEAELRWLTFRPEIKILSRKICHSFSEKEFDWGFDNFVYLDVVSNPLNGYVKDNAFILEVQIKADAPQGLNWNSIKNTEHITDSSSTSDEESVKNEDNKEETEIMSNINTESDLTKENGEKQKNLSDSNNESVEENEDIEETRNATDSRKKKVNDIIKEMDEEQLENFIKLYSKKSENYEEQSKIISDSNTETIEDTNKNFNEKEEPESHASFTNINVENDLTNSLHDMKKQSPDNDNKTDEGNVNEKSENEQKIKTRGEINLLLLSETGVGKSTFINSIANYLTYNSFDIAEKQKLRVLIPAAFLIEDKNGKRHKVSIGESDKNEFLNRGESATQDVKSYIFPVGRNHPNIRLIDTPGMGDTRGPEQDVKNCDYILNYIGNLRELHGICCLFKPLNSRNTVYFQYCITEILSRLDKSASKNILFLFTNTRGANYSSGETYEILKKTVDDIRGKTNVEIPLDEHIFCFDNEAFRYLAATQKNVKLSAEYKEKCRESWTRSKTQFWRMLKHIKKIEPHQVQSTSAINEARRMVNQLAQPLADISELIHDNIDALQKHEEKLDIENMSLEDLKNQMFMPVIDLEVVTLDQPTTACTALKCSEIYKVGDKNKWHYKQRCHEPCYLENVQADTIDNPALMGCDAMTLPSNFCARCGCSYRVHMHVYYMTNTIEQRIENSNALKNIDNKEKFLEEVDKLIADMVTKKAELENEHDTIVTSCAKFTHFLQNNAITPFNDSYKDYIEYLITREQSLGPKMSNKQSVVHLRKLLQKYEETKRLFDDSLKVSKKPGAVSAVTSKEIVETVKKLYGLKHSGKKIKELYESQQSSRKREHEYTEYIHSPGPKTFRDSKKKCNNAKKMGGYNQEDEKLYGSGNRESLFRRILGDFFGFVPWGTSKPRAKNQSEFRNGNTQTFRNVKKMAGAEEDFNFGSSNSFFNSQPYGAFVPFVPDQYNENAYSRSDVRMSGFYKWLFDLYNSSNNNVNQFQPNVVLQQLFDIYNSSVDATNNSNQNEQYHQPNSPPGRFYDQMASSSTYYRHDLGQQNPCQSAYFENKRQNYPYDHQAPNNGKEQTYFQRESDYNKLPGFPNESRDYHEASNFNNRRQHTSSHREEVEVPGFPNQYVPSSYHQQIPNFDNRRENAYLQREGNSSKATGFSNQPNPPRGYHKASNFNNRRQHTYPHRENVEFTGFSNQYNPSTYQQHISNFDNRRENTSPQRGGSYSKVTGFPNQLNPPRDYQETSNFNSGRQHTFSHRENYSEVAGFSNQYNKARGFNQASNFNNENKNTYSYDDSDYTKILSQKEVTEPPNQYSQSVIVDHEQASNFNTLGGRIKNPNSEVNDQEREVNNPSKAFGPTEHNCTQNIKKIQKNTKCSNTEISADHAIPKETNVKNNKSHPNKTKKVNITKAKKVVSKKKIFQKRRSGDEWESFDEES